MQTNIPVKIIIGEDHQLFAEGLEKLLHAEPEHYQVVAKAANGKELLHVINQVQPDLLLLDVNMPLVNGIDAAIQIKKKWPAVKIIFVSMDNSPGLIIRIKQHNFEGFVPKDIPVNLLKQVIGQVMANKTIYLGELKNDINTVKPDSLQTKQKLSQRQLEIVKLIQQGVTTNKEIAMVLSLSIFTIETHLKNIFHLVNVKNKVELMKYITEHRQNTTQAS